MNWTHWVYSFCMTTCKFGPETKVWTNPFTDESIAIPIDHGLTESDIEAIEHVFDSYGFVGPEPEGEGFVLYGADGDRLRFLCHHLRGEPQCHGFGVEMTVKELSADIVGIVLDVARAGDLAFVTSCNDDVAIPLDSLNHHVTARWPDARTVIATSELKRWIEDVVGGRQVCAIV